MASRLGRLDLLVDFPSGGSGSPADFLSFDPPPCVQLGRRDDLRGDVGGRGVAGTGGVLMGADHRAVHPIVQSGPSATSASRRNSSRILVRVPSPDQRRCRL